MTIGETDDLDMAKCRISMILTTMLRRDLDKSFHVLERDVAVVFGQDGRLQQVRAQDN